MTDLPLLTYVATMSVTPGPNNLMLAASGVNFGFRRSLRHMLGISFGHGIQVAFGALLFGRAMAAIEQWRPWLILVGCTYLLWLAWRQARADAPGTRDAAQPLGFVGAVLFQWVNPKAWMMVLNTVILFLPPGDATHLVPGLALVCAAVNLPCIMIWAAAGDRLRVHLREPRRLRIFNLSMALLLAGTALWIALDAQIVAGTA